MLTVELSQVLFGLVCKPAYRIVDDQALHEGDEEEERRRGAVPNDDARPDRRPDEVLQKLLLQVTVLEA